jgi:DNA-binding CsgD family transcriptional regulator
MSRNFTTMSAVAEEKGLHADFHAMKSVFPPGAQDALGIESVDATASSVSIVGLLPKAMRTPREPRHLIDRLLAHVLSAIRLRIRLVGAPVLPAADAVLEPGGKLVHAEGKAKERESREALRAAAIAVDRARGPIRQRDGDEAVEIWTALFEGRWSLIEHFDSDGRRFLLAERNDPKLPPRPLLTERELAVLHYRALGRSIKLIAYELGLSLSTVSGALRSGMKKLRVKSVAELGALLAGPPAPMG